AACCVSRGSPWTLCFMGSSLLVSQCRSGLAWLACGPQLEVVHAVTGERLSAYCFCGDGEHPPSVLAARDFCWLKRTGLLVGLEEAQGSMLCLYDLGISRVVKAVVIPGRIRAIEPLVSYGGASASTQHLHQSLRWFFGVAAVVTDLGHVLLMDLCLDDLSCSQSELEASDLEVVSKSLAEIPRLREQETRQGRHLCLQLSSPTGTGATALQYIPRTNQLAVGFSDGYLQLWNMKTLKKEYHSQLEGGRVPVYAFTFQEPENDPRNCCYLWAIQSAQDHEGDVVSLHLLQLAFSERKCLASGKILYEGLEYCEERYSQELSSTAFPLRAQATNTRLLSCQTIEKFRHHPDRDDSMNEVASPDTSVSIFSWQVKAYGQGNPSTYIGVFDINRWYHAQMPDSLRTGESLRSCPYLAVWSLDSVVEMTSPCPLLDVLVHERSLSRGLPYTCPPPEQFFKPTTYNFDATCLLNTGIVHLTCSGYQKETLSFLKKAAPCSSDVISNGYSRCLMSGLLSSRLADVQPSSLSQEEQLDAILSTAIETSSLGLITSCIKQWTAEEQPGSAVNLRYILEWAWDKVVHTKEQLDGICAPLFDSSSNFTDSPTLQLLQHSQRLLGNLSTIFHCLLREAQELTQRGLLGLINKNLVSSLISQYAQVVLWFCRTGLLPEGSDEDAVQIPRPFYSYSVNQNYYTIRREELQQLSKGKWCADCLMIDGLVAQCGDRLVDLWKRDEGGTGQYPPPTLHGLLDIYLLENIDESAKHAIVIYLLLDVMYSFPNKSGGSVESFPTAFAIPIGLVKLVQGFWLLDHHDHQNSLEMLLHPTTSPSLWGWQHDRILQALMCQGKHGIALRYLHVMKPPLSSTAQAQLCLAVLLHNRCLVEAWAMLRQHSNSLNTEELLSFLYQTCQELGLMKELLKLPLGLAEQECLERFLQGTGGLQNRELLMMHYLQQANYVPALQLNHTLKMNMVNERDPKLKERTKTRNSILDQYGKVLPRVQRKLATERAKPYHHPSTILREVSRPQPLSTIAKRSANENVLTRAAFINSVLSKIEEVWVGKNPTPQSSPLKSPRAAEVLFPSRDLPEAFVGTPITMSSKRKSRVLDLVVHPSQTTPPEGARPLLTPPRAASSWNLPKSINKAPELSLLQTPQVVKRARALAMSGPLFSAFTPQSILRSSLRPTPVATPSASPGRSVTPPLCPKESRITFIEETASQSEKGTLHWSNGISLLTRGSPLSKAGPEAWTSHSADYDEEGQEEVKVTHVKFLQPPVREPSPERGESESGSSVVVTALPSTLPGRLSLGLETSQASVLSTDTTLEFHDAPLPEDLEMEALQHPANEVTDEDDDEVVVNLKTQEVLEAPLSKEEVQPAAANGLTLLLSLEEGQNKDPEVKEEEVNLDEFVERHLFGNDLSPPLTRSGIHKASDNWTSFNRYVLKPVVSLNDSEELSSSVLEDDDDDDEDESDGPAEQDSGSEVEVIEEVQGNGRQRAPLPPPSLFLDQVPQPHPQFLPALSEQDAAVLSLVTTEADLKMVEDDLEGEVVMVRLGVGGDEAEGVCYTELKPSTTLLVPLELVEGHALADGAHLGLIEVGEGSQPEGMDTLEGMDSWTEAETGGTEAMSMENVPLVTDVLPESFEAKPATSAEDVDTDNVEEPDEIPADSEPTKAEEVSPVLDEIEQPNGAMEETEEETLSCARQKEMKADVVELEEEREEPVSVPADQSLSQVEKAAQTGKLSIASVEERKPDKTSNSQSKSVEEISVGVRKAPSTPTRRTSNQRKMVKFTSVEAERPGSEDERLAGQTEMETDAQVPITPRRITRSSRHSQDFGVPVTPRRSARKTESQPEPEPWREQEERKREEEVPAATVVLSKATPTKRRTPQKATPRTGTRQTRNTQVGSNREPTAMDETANQVSVQSVTRSARKSTTGTKAPAAHTQSVVPEEEEKGNDERAKQPSSPGRVTRKSTRAGVTLALFTEGVVALTPPRSRRKTRGEGTAEKTPSALALDDPPLSVYRRPPRSRLWNHQEEDLPLLETPLEVVSGTPVADALIQRLRDEEVKREVVEAPVITEMVRVKRRVTKSLGQRSPSPLPMGDIMVPETDQGSPVRDSFIYSPPRRRTRGNLLLIEKNSSEDDVEKETAAAKTKAPKRRTTKRNAAPPPPAKVDLISPMPSPAKPAPRTTRRLVVENNAPASRMNLRRKRVLEAIFPKSVTRRKKL
uniref:AT hook containing transcription factor 1 n=1 Tax=Oncorhynchus kisutch TaxID=8019 RepID=A0A8C7FXE1_ONCKI